MKELPKFYNSLEETRKEIFSLLFQGVKKRKSNFHNLVLNTIDLQNKPDARTVVLRSFSQEDLTKSDALFSSVSLTSSVKYFPWRIFFIVFRPMSPSAFSTAFP